MYNIPIEFFVPVEYPTRCPKCYVRPSAGMAIREGHRNVDMNGMIYMPYLSEWRPRSHTLAEMIVRMQSFFCVDPPVYAVPAHRGSGGGSNVHASSRNVGGSSRYSLGGAAGYGQNSNSNGVEPPPPSYDYVDSVHEQRRKAAEEERARREREEEERRRLRIQEEERARLVALEVRTTKESKSKVTEKLQIYVNSEYSKAKDEWLKQRRREQELANGKRDIEQQLSFLESTKDKLQDQLDKLTVQTVKLEGLLPEIEAKESEQVSADDLAVPKDVLSKQLLHLSAKDAAYSDLFYHMQQAFYNKTIETNEYFETVRKLAREQFTCRYHLKKVALAIETR